MGGEDVLEVFKGKISECISMVGLMGPKDRISAVEIWNEISEKLQEVINHSVEEIDRLELEFENKSTDFDVSSQESSNISTSISKEHTYNFVIKDGEKVPPAEENNPTVRAGESSVVLSHIDGQTIILSSSFDEMKTNTDLVTCEAGEEEELVMTDLSGQVLIVSEGEETMTVTGEDGVPHKVLQLEVKDWDKSFADLTWQPPQSDGGAPILSYLLECKEKFSSDWVRCLLTSDSSCAGRVEDVIKEGQTYEFRAKAVNKAGEGEPSLPTKPVVIKSRFIKPFILGERMTDQVTKRGQNLSWDIRYDGEPDPELHWFFNDVEIIADAR